MTRKIIQVALLVNDYDEAIDYYIKKLGFVLIEDTKLDKAKRWVLISPDLTGSSRLLLAKASDEEQKTRIGNQTGGRVFLFLHTDNFDRDYQGLIDNQVKIVRPPVKQVYGTVAVFEDLYGNLWDLIGDE